MTREEQIALFDPNGVGVKGSLFGLPFTEETAAVVVIPVPWDVTTSYGSGTADGPLAILNASSQIDYGQTDIPDAWKLGICMAEIPEVWLSLGKGLRTKATQYIDWLEAGSQNLQDVDFEDVLREVNQQCAQLMKFVEQETAYCLDRKKLTVLLGGDHSTVLGHMAACAQHYGDFGVLQIDAHADFKSRLPGF